ncbi:MAG: CoA-binding protein [Promethearchaeati archaeon SRVP18_Atabeyarchaeia-1]
MSSHRKEGIRCLFDPRSIAVIGASNQPITWGNWIAKNVVEASRRRRVFLVNPKARTILGQKAYASVKDIEDEFELAVLVISADKVIQVAEDCISKKAKAIQIISGGFREATEWGQEAQERLTSIARETRVTIQGPNCNGSINASADMNTSSTPNHLLRDSPIGFATQSGYIGNTFSYNGPATGVTFGKYVSLGNECDLTVTDVIEYFGEDPSTKVIMSYIEGVRNGERFKKVVKEVARKKPIVVYKVGEWESGARAALSHTASIAGSYNVYKGLFKQSGVAQIPDLDMLPRIANAFVKYPLMRGRNVALITIGAGWGVSLSDSLPRGDLQVQQFSAELQERLRKFIPSERASVKNPIDFGAGGTYDPVIMVKLIGQLLSDRESDAIVVSGVGEMTPIEPDSLPWEVDLAARAYEESLTYGKPIVFFTPLTRLSSASVGKLIDKGIPIAHSISEVVTTLSSLHFRWRYLKEHP